MIVARGMAAADNGNVGGTDRLGPLLWWGALASTLVSMSPYRCNTFRTRYVRLSGVPRQGCAMQHTPGDKIVSNRFSNETHVSISPLDLIDVLPKLTFQSRPLISPLILKKGHRFSRHCGDRRGFDRRGAGRGGRWRPAHFVDDHFRISPGTVPYY